MLYKKQDRQYTYSVTLRRISTTSVVVMHIRNVSVALVIRHAKRMRRIALSSVACLAVP
jgi:hypothetical protein